MIRLNWPSGPDYSRPHRGAGGPPLEQYGLARPRCYVNSEETWLPPELEQAFAVVSAASRIDIIFKGPSDRKLLALTSDDFPSSGSDQRESGTMALLDLPGELGNHRWRDQWSLSLAREAFIQQKGFSFVTLSTWLGQG